VIISQANRFSCVMKLSHFLRYFENTHGVLLPCDKVDEEAAKLGIVIDRTGETRGDNKPSFEQPPVAA
jgi:hypothetical protein